MLSVPVVSSIGKPLMPCHPARARELVRNNRAVRRFNRGLFYIELTSRQDGDTQCIAVGVDPGSKKEAFTVKSGAHTFLNIQADAVTWVKDAMETRRNLRKSRRHRKTPYRQIRVNRTWSGLAPSTRARWGWKLRMAAWLSGMYPITTFVVEDVSAHTRGGRRWNLSFSPIQTGKKWFYAKLGKIAHVEIRKGWETKKLRDYYGLKKSKDKMSEKFAAHCVDSWVLANSFTGGHAKPDNMRMLLVTPLRFHRRQLHVQNPIGGGVRKHYGSTHSNGFKRGSLVLHAKYGLAYVGGFSKKRISLHSLIDGKRLTQSSKTEDCRFLTFNSWRAHLLPRP